MRADDARRESAFMYYDVPKKDQETVPESMTTEECGRISADHIVITMIGPAAEDVFMNERYKYYDLYDSSGELRHKDYKHIPPGDFEQYVALPRSILLKLLEPMTSDWVKISITNDYPAAVAGMIGEKYAAAYIAPGIEDRDLNN